VTEIFAVIWTYFSNVRVNSYNKNEEREGTIMENSKKFGTLTRNRARCNVKKRNLIFWGRRGRGWEK